MSSKNSCTLHQKSRLIVLLQWRLCVHRFLVFHTNCERLTHWTLHFQQRSVMFRLSFARRWLTKRTLSTLGQGHSSPRSIVFMTVACQRLLVRQWIRPGVLYVELVLEIRGDVQVQIYFQNGPVISFEWIRHTHNVSEIASVPVGNGSQIIIVLDHPGTLNRAGETFPSSTVSVAPEGNVFFTEVCETVLKRFTTSPVDYGQTFWWSTLCIFHSIFSIRMWNGRLSKASRSSSADRYSWKVQLQSRSIYSRSFPFLVAFDKVADRDSNATFSTTIMIRYFSRTF